VFSVRNQEWHLALKAHVKQSQIYSKTFGGPFYSALKVVYYFTRQTIAEAKLQLLAQ